MATPDSGRRTMRPTSVAVGVLGAAFGLGALFVATYYPGLPVVVWSLGGAGAAGLLFFVASERRVLGRVPGTRAARYGANSTAMTAAFLGILVVLNVLAVRHNEKWDATAEKAFTLSEQTRKVLRNLKREVAVTAFYQDGAEGRDTMRRLLQGYRDQSAQLKVSFVDPDKSPELARKYGIRAYGTTVFESGAQTSPVTEPTEEAVTNALVRVTRETRKTLYFLTGHDEHSIQDTQRTGYFKAKTALEGQGYATRELPVIPREGVPRDCDVLLVPGPLKPLLDSEIEAVRTFLSGGGRVLLMLEPGSTQGLDPVLSDWGVVLQGDQIIDAMSPLSGTSYLTLLLTRYVSHEITRDFRQPCVIPGARSVAKADPLPKGITFTPLVQTDPQSSWGETDPRSIAPLLKGEKTPEDLFDRKTDVPGPLTVIALFEKKEVFVAGAPKVNGQLLVAGDSDFADNAYFHFLGNGDLFQNLVNYLARDEDLLSIRPKDARPSPLTLTRAQGATLFYSTVVLGPLALALSGLAIWWKRKNL
ncbi:MAG: GldG family protein [Deltaproteobacteria bacterium]|nr:GldG family protein [Deltaproteobacteria bacterium]